MSLPPPDEPTPDGEALTAEHKINFGRNLRTARHHLGLTQTELASRVKITQTRLAQIEAGNVNLTLSTMARIAHAINCSIQSLIGPETSFKP